MRLLRLDGAPGRKLEIDVLQELPARSGERIARLAVHGDWPNGTAVAISTSRGTTTPAVLLTEGRADFPLAYAAEEVGRASSTSLTTQ